uniref:interleukin-17 receptor A-like n=1 Tax=Myxine glutinosa TaxID=7769 RepID=UPI0035901FA3
MFAFLVISASILCCDVQARMECRYGLFLTHNNCSQDGLNCTMEEGDGVHESWLKGYKHDPSSPKSLNLSILYREDEDGDGSAWLHVRWEVNQDGSIRWLKGAEILIASKDARQTRVFLHFHSNFTSQTNPAGRNWAFMFNDFRVREFARYTVIISHLPINQLHRDHNYVKKSITVPGCSDEIMKRTWPCKLRGASCEANLAVKTIEESAHISFTAGSYFTSHNVTICHCGNCETQIHHLKGIHDGRNTVVKNYAVHHGCSMNVTVCPIAACRELTCPCTRSHADTSSTWSLVKWVVIVPTGFLLLLIIIVCVVRIKHHRKGKTIGSHCCNSSGDRLTAGQISPDLQLHLSPNPVVLLLYSLDYHTYKDAVLALASLLQAETAVSVSLNLWSSADVSQHGLTAWLHGQWEAVTTQGGHVLVLCSHAGFLKWQAFMAGSPLPRYPEESHSGDVFGLALPLLCSAAKANPAMPEYSVAYFDELGDGDNDVPRVLAACPHYELPHDLHALCENFRRMFNSGKGNTLTGSSKQTLLASLGACKRWQKANPSWYEASSMI